MSVKPLYLNNYQSIIKSEAVLSESNFLHSLQYFNLIS
jgi:hypothetical protein